jgi:hypothetical protein
MFDLNKIVTDALTAAVQQAIAPLVEQIAVLEQRIATLSSQDVAMGGRIDALETKLTEAKLFEQTTNVTIPIDEAKMVEALNSQEWFWEKLRCTTDAQIEQAMDDHCSTYDHDDYDNVVSNWNDEDPTEFVREGDLSSQINDVLNGASFDVRISI